jgi:xylulose-5-phosphate/fructose-6-phosphate phosphoketolase
MKTRTLTPDILDRIDAYWRAANYLSVGQIYLFDNPLLKRPLTLGDIRHMLLGHWGRADLQKVIPDIDITARGEHLTSVAAGSLPGESA